MTLDKLSPGEEAVISGFTDIELSLKLMEMGFIPGEKIKVFNYAPLGDPMSVFIQEYKLIIRKEEAKTILITSQY